MLTFYVPPGIGDFSAMYSKLCNTGREILIKSSADGPRRLSPFLDILPKVANGGYAAHTANTSIGQTLSPGTDIRMLDDGEYFLSINQWLEDGNRVEDWIPGETSFHYPFQIPEKDGLQAIQLLLPFAEAPKIGVYTSAYGNARHWGFWDWERWRDFLKEVATHVPKETHFIFIGAEYDLAISEIVYDWMETEGYHAKSFIGLQKIGGTIELIRHLDYLFSFPSGLGFLADVVNTPNMMWFPKGFDPMRYTFIDPVNIDSGQTRHHVFTSPLEATKEFIEGPGLKHFQHRLERRGKVCQG